MNDKEYLAAAIRVALKKGIICQSMEVDQKKSLREGKSINGEICLFNKNGTELGKINKESIKKYSLAIQKVRSYYTSTNN